MFPLMAASVDIVKQEINPSAAPSNPRSPSQTSVGEGERSARTRCSGRSVDHFMPYCPSFLIYDKNHTRRSALCFAVPLCYTTLRARDNATRKIPISSPRLLIIITILLLPRTTDFFCPATRSTRSANARCTMKYVQFRTAFGAKKQGSNDHQQAEKTRNALFHLHIALVSSPGAGRAVP